MQAANGDTRPEPVPAMALAEEHQEEGKEHPHHKGLFGKLEEARAHQAGHFQQEERQAVKAAKHKIEELESQGYHVDARPGQVHVAKDTQADTDTAAAAGGAAAAGEGGAQPRKERHGLGKVLQLFDKLEEVRSHQVGDFQAHRQQDVEAARRHLEEERAAGHKVVARPGLVSIH